MLRAFLEIGGYEVIEAVDGQEAVEKALAEHPDLILMDLAMPVLDGLQATRAIRRHRDLSETPVIAFTAFGDFYRSRALEAGCNELVQKPMYFEQLYPLVERYVGH